MFRVPISTYYLPPYNLETSTKQGPSRKMKILICHGRNFNSDKNLVEINGRTILTRTN